LGSGEVVTWKFLFIGITVLLLYFAYGVASNGGPWAFFSGAAVGCIVTYLFTRYKQEAMQAHLEARQKVQVTVNQQKTNISQPLTPQQIARIVESVIEQKQLLMNGRASLNPHEREVSRELLSNNLWDLAENDDESRR
jgi:hypothetical protein